MMETYKLLRGFNDIDCLLSTQHPTPEATIRNSINGNQRAFFLLRESLTSRIAYRVTLSQPPPYLFLKRD